MTKLDFADIAIGFIIGIVTGLVGAIQLNQLDYRVNLDNVPHVEFVWTKIELEEIASYKQFWTKDELLKMVTHFQMMNKMQQMMIIENEAPVPSGSQRAEGGPAGNEVSSG